VSDLVSQLEAGAQQVGRLSRHTSSGHDSTLPLLLLPPPLFAILLLLPPLIDVVCLHCCVMSLLSPSLLLPWSFFFCRYVDVLADGHIEPSERPAAAAAAIAGAKAAAAAAAGSASPNKLALQLLDCLLVLCIEVLGQGMQGQQGPFAAAAVGPVGHQVVTEVIQGLQQGLIAVQYQLSGWNEGHQGAGGCCRELLQAYAAAAAQGCGGGGFNSLVPHVLMRLAQLL
jgi:hypothetical protein